MLRLVLLGIFFAFPCHSLRLAQYTENEVDGDPLVGYLDKECSIADSKDCPAGRRTHWSHGHLHTLAHRFRTKFINTLEFMELAENEEPFVTSGPASKRQTFHNMAKHYFVKYHQSFEKNFKNTLDKQLRMGIVYQEVSMCPNLSDGDLSTKMNKLWKVYEKFLLDNKLQDFGAPLDRSKGSKGSKKKHHGGTGFAMRILLEHCYSTATNTEIAKRWNELRQNPVFGHLVRGSSVHGLVTTAQASELLALKDATYCVRHHAGERTSDATRLTFNSEAVTGMVDEKNGQVEETVTDSDEVYDIVLLAKTVKAVGKFIDSTDIAVDLFKKHGWMEEASPWSETNVARTTMRLHQIDFQVPASIKQLFSFHGTWGNPDMSQADVSEVGAVLDVMLRQNLRVSLTLDAGGVIHTNLGAEYDKVQNYLNTHYKAGKHTDVTKWVDQKLFQLHVNSLNAACTTSEEYNYLHFQLESQFGINSGAYSAGKHAPIAQ